MKRHQLLQAGTQLNLFDTEPEDSAGRLPPLSAPTVLKRRRLLLGGRIIEYSLRRARRRSIGFVIDDDGLRMSAPRWVTLAEIEEAIRSKQRWVLQKLDEHHKRLMLQAGAPAPWQEGATVAFLGQNLVLRTGDALLNEIHCKCDALFVPRNAATTDQTIRHHVHTWLQTEAQHLFAQKLSYYSQKLGVTYRSFALSHAKTQWGACSAQGRIRLNWRLIHLPPELIDYVIVHELSHLREMNHGPAFWATVSSILPDYDSARKSLRRYSPTRYPA